LFKPVPEVILRRVIFETSTGLVDVSRQEKKGLEVERERERERETYNVFSFS